MAGGGRDGTSNPSNHPGPNMAAVTRKLRRNCEMKTLRKIDRDTLLTFVALSFWTFIIVATR